MMWLSVMSRLATPPHESGCAGLVQRSTSQSAASLSSRLGGVMADPISIAMIAATAVGGGISAYGQYSGGQAQKQYYDFMARNAIQMANIARLKAGRDIMAGEQEAQKFGIQTAQIRGGTIARAGAGNVATGMGSTAQVYMSQLA